MPIEMQTKPVVPNAIYAPMILIQASVIDGKLRYSCQLTIAACEEKDGVWKEAGQSKTIYIPDVLNLDEDISHLSHQIEAVFGGILYVVNALNTIRKIL